jgi:peptidoglycan DL-endopeptidase CwlO
MRALHGPLLAVAPILLGLALAGAAGRVSAQDSAQQLAQLNSQLGQDQAKLDRLNDQVQKAQADLDRLNRTLLEDQQSESQLQQQMVEVARAAYERPPASATAILQAGQPDLSSSAAAQGRLIAARQQQLLAEAQRLHDEDQKAHDQQAAKVAEITSARDQASQVAARTLKLRDQVSDSLFRARAQSLAQQALATQAAAVQPVFTSPSSGSDTGIANHFPAGYCTWYVASRRGIPWYGNAIDWWDNARTYGYAEGQQPMVGAIMVTRESPVYGHVAYVESVGGDGSWTVSEMNFKGWKVQSGRTLHPGQVPLVGFIYGKS